MGRILLIEDQAPLRRVLKVMLEMLEHELVVAGSAREGLDVLDAAPAESIGAVIADLDIPDVLEAFATLRRRLPVIGMTRADPLPDLGVPLLPSPPSILELAAVLRELSAKLT